MCAHCSVTGTGSGDLHEPTEITSPPFVAFKSPLKYFAVKAISVKLKEESL